MVPDGVGGLADGQQPGFLVEQIGQAFPEPGCSPPGGCPASARVTPRSAAAISQGETLASWSRRVMMISSPGCQVRARARLKLKVRLVMFWPKAISSGRALSRSATACRAWATMSSAWRLVAKRRRPGCCYRRPGSTPLLRNDRLGGLGAAGAVEENGRFAIHFHLQRRKLSA
jgi:hypothetical protein